MPKIKNKNLDIIIYFLAKVLSGILGFVQVSILTYFLMPDVYGDYSLIIGLLNVIVAIFIGWISSSILRYYSKFKDDQHTFFTNVIIDWIIVSVISIILILISGALSINILIKEYLITVILLLIFYSIYEIFCHFLRASKETLIYLIIVVSNYVLNISLFFLFKYTLSSDLTAILLASGISYVITSTFLFFKFKMFELINFKYFSKELQLKFLRYGLPMIGVWATSWVLNYSDRYIIKLFYSSTEVGYYDIAYKISENTINMIITSLLMAMMPHLIDYYNEKNDQNTLSYYSKFLKLFYILVIPSIFGLIAIRYAIYNTLISSNYIPGIDIIIYISISMFFYGLCQFIFKLLQLTEKTNIILVIMILSVIFNIVANFIFVPRYGFIVAAVTTLLSNILSLIIAYIYTRRKFAVKFEFNYLIKTILCGLMMFYIVKLIITNTILGIGYSIIVGGLIYFVSLLLFKVITLKDINKLKFINKK